VSGEGKLRFRLWIEEALVVDELVSLEDAISAAERHARRSIEATANGQLYTLEVCDPDDGDRVVQRVGTDLSRMERPIRIEMGRRNAGLN
jgi:hypothetical protein